MRVPRWLPPLLWAGVIVFATSVPASALPRRIGGYDKAIHFTMYAVLAALVTRAVLGGSVRARLLALVLVIVGTVAFGAVDEWHQRFIPGRSTELGDWIADSAGAIVATAFMALRSTRATQRRATA